MSQEQESKVVGASIVVSESNAKNGKPKALSVREKEKVEKLIDKRSSNLLEYVNEISGFVNQLAENSPFSGEEEVRRLQTERDKLSVEDEQLEADKKSELEAVTKVLDEEQTKKVSRINNLLTKLKAQHKDKIAAANKVVEDKFRRQTEKLIEKRNVLQAQITDMESRRATESVLRTLTIRNGFSKLRDSIQDERNRAVEKVWTECDYTDDAKKALDLLPDASVFREQVSPKMLVGVYNDRVQLVALPDKRLKCEQCSSHDIRMHGDSAIYCNKCRKYSTLSEDFIKGVQLPTIREVVSVS